MRQLLTSCLYLTASGAASAAQTAVTGNTIDTQGYEDVTIIANLGTITATGIPTLKAQQGDEDDGGDAADIEGASVVGTSDDSNKSLAIEIHRPKQRYITPVLNRATANIVVQNIIVILHNPTHVPVDQSQIVGSVALITPENAA